MFTDKNLPKGLLEAAATMLEGNFVRVEGNRASVVTREGKVLKTFDRADHGTNFKKLAYEYRTAKEEVNQIDEISPKLARKAAAASGAKHYDYSSSAYGPGADKESDRLEKKADKARAHVQKRQGDKGSAKVDRLTNKLVFGKSRMEEVEIDEKMDMKKADMGDVIKDFQKSDAPQFKGKSDAKKREMAIAAKLAAEGKKMDPVGKEDGDIDNDGDKDKSDQYLHNRRKAIKKAMTKEAKDYCDCGCDCGEAVCESCGKPHKKADMKETSNAPSKENGGIAHMCATHVKHATYGEGRCVPEMHSIVETEDGEGYVSHYDVMFSGDNGPFIVTDCPVEELEIVSEMKHGHSKKK